MQQINFYQAQFKPKKQILPAWQFLAILGIAVISLCLVSIALYALQPDTEQQIARYQTSITQKQQQLSKLEQKLNDNTENPLLRTQFNKLKQKLVDEKALLDYVSSHKLGNKNGFSSTLTAFSEHYTDGVWLTEFALLNAGQYTAINGRANSADLVPIYIDSLAEAAPFKGKTFSVFNLQKASDSQYFEFQLFSTGRNKTN